MKNYVLLLFTTLLILLLSSPIVGQQNQKITFDKLTTEIPVKGSDKKTHIRVIPDTSSNSHFTVIIKSPNNDSVWSRFYTQEKEIETNKIHRLIRERKIIIDGISKSFYKNNHRTETFYVMGKKEGCETNYRKDTLYRKAHYRNNKIIDEEYFYRNGKSRAKIVKDEPYQQIMGNDTITVYHEFITEYYENGNIKREEKHNADEEVIWQKHYTPKGKDTIFSVPFRRKPSYPGGEERLNAYIRKYMKYPQRAIRERREGEVVVRFLVSKDGSIRNIKTVKSLASDLNKEAERLVRNMPRWEPALFCGEPSSTYHRVTVHFSLEGYPVEKGPKQRPKKSKEPDPVWGEW